MIPHTLDQAHARYLQQAGWTRAIRERALLRFELRRPEDILEVGSGTGAITAELRQVSTGTLVGLDRDTPSNVFAQARTPRLACVTGLGEQLPFPPACFDVACCHFLLLWVDDPLVVLLEMKRVTKPGGAVLCLAEPDYGGRIDFPATLSTLGALQETALRAQGAQTRIGREMRALLHQAGLKDIQTGVLGGEWPDAAVGTCEQLDLEWDTLAQDLRGLTTQTELRDMEARFTQAREDGTGVLFIPTFYGWGTCPHR